MNNKVLWLIEGSVLFFAHYLTGRGPINDGKDNFIGPLVIVIGVVILVWTLKYVSKEMVTSGPYRYARHPMHVGINTILFGIGLYLFSWLWFIIMLAFVPLWILKYKLEENQMINLYGKEYLTYKKKVGIFFPKMF